MLVTIAISTIKRAQVVAVNCTKPATVIRGGVHFVTVTTGSDFASDIRRLVAMETRGTVHWEATPLGMWGVTVSLLVIGFQAVIIYPIP